MPDCENCNEKCPQAEMAHEIALGRMYATQELVRLVKEIESGQLVEVVRCEDCKHLLKVFKEDVERGGGICGKAYGTGKIEGYLCRVNAYDFCSYGERT